MSRCLSLEPNRRRLSIDQVALLAGIVSKGELVRYIRGVSDDMRVDEIDMVKLADARIAIGNMLRAVGAPPSLTPDMIMRNALAAVRL